MTKILLPRTPPDDRLIPTKEQLIARTKVRIQRLLLNGHEQIKTNLRQLTEEVQQNRDGLTAQEVLSGFGDEAQTLLGLREKLAELLDQVEIQK